MEDSRAKKDQLQEDLTETDRLLNLTENPRLTFLLSQFRAQTLISIQSLPDSSLLPIPEESKSLITFQNISKFAWDQDLYWVKIYVTSLPDLTDVPNEQLQFEHTEDSIDVKLIDIGGVNYRLVFKQLSKSISDAQIKYKKNGFLIRMKKKPAEPWNEVEFKPTERIKSKHEAQDPLTKARNIILDEYDKVWTI